MKLLKLLVASILMLMACTSISFAEYSFQLVKPPGAVDANLFGINNAGKAVGNAFDEFGFFAKIWDVLYHSVLPLTCYVVGSFAFVTLMMKNHLRGACTISLTSPR